MSQSNQRETYDKHKKAVSKLYFGEKEADCKCDCTQEKIIMALKHLDKWRAHLDKVRKEHPKLSLKEAMKLASRSYKK